MSTDTKPGAKIIESLERGREFERKELHRVLAKKKEAEQSVQFWADQITHHEKEFEMYNRAIEAVSKIT